MKEFLIDKFEYDIVCNRRFLDAIFSHENKVNEYILKSISHLVNAQHLWNSRILQKEPEFGVWEVHVLNSLSILIEELNKQSIQILDEMNLADGINYSNSKDERFVNSIEEIMYHVLNHSNYHRAQIAAEMRSLGITPPESNYIYYKR